MIGIQQNDICFSTALKGHNPFNTDGVERDTLSPELARTAFDFDIIKRPSFDATGRQIPKQYHLVREDNMAFIPSYSIGEKYTPVQHLDVFDYIVNKVMPEIPSLELEMAGTIHGCGTSLIAAKFGDTFAIPGDKSENHLRLFFRNPCNGTGSLTLGFTNVRVICQNTLLAATEEAKQDGWSIKHTKGAPILVKNAVKSIETQAVAALEMKERCKRLASLNIDSDTLNECLDAVYPAFSIPDGPGRIRMLNLRKEVIRQFEVGETAQTMEKKSAWALFNSFTYPIHHPEKLRKEQDLAEVQYKAMASDKALKIRKIFETIENIAA